MSLEAFIQSIRSSDPLISAIVPCYNKSQHLAEAVESLLDQNYSNLEILIIDDGSSDNTPQVALNLIQKYHKFQIKYLRKPNGGPSDARNMGYRSSKGSIILMLDGDDIVRPGFITLGLAAMREHGANLVCTYLEEFGAESNVWRPPNYEPFSIRYENCFPNLSLTARELWDKNRGMKVALPFNEDWDFWINCSRHELIVYQIQEPMLLYRRASDGLAKVFIKDTWQMSVSMMMTCNEDLYPVSEVLWAHTKLASSPAHWVERFTDYSKRYPDQWILKLWLGMFADVKGNTNEAILAYTSCAELSAMKQWQPLYRLAQLLETLGDKNQASKLLHECRILRPDLNSLVKDKINSYSILDSKLAAVS